MSLGWLLLQNTICLIILGFGEYGNHIRVAAQCKQPNPDGRSGLSVVKSSYAVNEVVGVLCIPGYRPFVKEITCKRNWILKFHWSSTPQCIDQCKKPNPAGRFSLSIEKDYYDVDEVVIVQCNQGYQTRVKRITCRWPESEDQWDPAPQCVEQCKKPNNNGNYTLSGSGNFYDVGQSATVRCSTGYQPLYERIKCVAPRSRSEWDNDPLCIAQCKKPYPDGTYSLSVEKEYYNVEEVVTVQCNEGYRPLVKEIRCRRRGSADQWDRTPRCIPQCKKPESTGNYTLSGSGKFYDVGESVTVRCRTGYRPLYERIRCVAPGRRSEWDTEPLCIAQCKKPNPDGRYSLSVEKEYYDVGESVTVQCSEGHRPQVTRITCRSWGSAVHWDWTPLCIIPNLPHIMKGPSMEDGRIRWILLNREGLVTGYKLDIEARRDSDPSVTGHQSHWFPPNVTECEILLQPGINYTVTIRAVTSSGGGASDVYVVETPPIGGRRNVTGTSNSTRSSIVSLDLESMLWLVVPIFTVKLLVLVVLLKIQFTLIAGKTSETDLDRHEKPKEYRILYRKREEEFVSIQNGPGDNVCSDPKEAAHS
ncbi:coagulation factor XIII B chain-like isoform X2 [Bufo bufo]|uniref:coagulation factor XIII B chain-like isoform X2 n=1 Tax=Bufo bufo TaxID=8384 RepID=UPI001ABE8ADC|nr:coagulation factor XIII B chain-like isoform X2 [Bufo bufo]